MDMDKNRMDTMQNSLKTGIPLTHVAENANFSPWKRQAISHLLLPLVQ